MFNAFYHLIHYDVNEIAVSSIHICRVCLLLSYVVFVYTISMLVWDVIN